MIKNVYIGYVAVNTRLHKKNIYTDRTVIRATIEKQGGPRAIEAYMQKLALANIADVLTILKWNEENGIKFYRITSNLFSHVNDAFVVEKYPTVSFFRGDIEFAKPALALLGSYAAEHGHRLSFHSNPYVVLCTPRPGVLSNAIFDIGFHYRIYQYIMSGTHGRSPHKMVMILHIGGAFGDFQMAKRRWVAEYLKLSAHLREFVVLENTERYGDIISVLDMHDATRTPTERGVQVVFDFFHNVSSEVPEVVNKALLDRICATWVIDDPKFHYSEQRPNARIGAHSDSLARLPADLFKYAALYPRKKFWLMLETKDKESAVLKMLKLKVN